MNNKFPNYLKQIGLGDLIKDLEKTDLNNFVTEVFSQAPPPLSEEIIKNLYEYVVPKLSPDGSCSILDVPADKPYSLAETFNLESDWKKLKNHPQTLRLWRLNKLVKKIFGKTKVNWFGVYRKIINPKGELVLAKEAYKGVFSRPEFPLTPEFAKKSNNSTVGLTGKAIIIQDVNEHSGAYYNCDSKVNSEFCVPILSKKNEVIGIIDAEAFPTNHYTSEKLLQIAKVAYDSDQIN